VRERLEEERDETDDAVFMSSFIPRNLGEVYDPERDVDLVKAGRGDELIYSTLTGVLGRSTKETSGTGSGSASTTRDDKEQVAAEADPATGADEHDGDADRNEDDDDENEYDTSKPRGFRNEDKDAKKVSHETLFGAVANC
jgi:RIO kinase 1